MHGKTEWERQLSDILKMFEKLVCIFLFRFLFYECQMLMYHSNHNNEKFDFISKELASFNFLDENK